MATYYAWSNFPTERNEFGQTTKTIKPGDKVTQQDLDVSDDEWNELIELGAVREEEYPDTDPGQSPAEYALTHPDEEAPIEPSPATQVTPPLTPAQTGVKADTAAEK
jgi:hypothetical protein